MTINSAKKSSVVDAKKVEKANSVMTNLLSELDNEIIPVNNSNKNFRDMSSSNQGNTNSNNKNPYLRHSNINNSSNNNGVYSYNLYKNNPDFINEYENSKINSNKKLELLQNKETLNKSESEIMELTFDVSNTSQNTSSFLNGRGIKQVEDFSVSSNKRDRDESNNLRNIVNRYLI